MDRMLGDWSCIEFSWSLGVRYGALVLDGLALRLDWTETGRGLTVFMPAFPFPPLFVFVLSYWSFVSRDDNSFCLGLDEVMRRGRVI